MKQIDVAVIGGGAAGLMAAISAARNGAKTIILEHMDRVGKKILATGNGKCNYTNAMQGGSCYRGENPAFVVPVFEQFDWKKTVAFFEELGIYPKVKNGYYYPASEQAASVLDVLRMEAAYLGIREEVSCNIMSITVKGDGFRLKTDRGDFFARSVIMATGLLASPKTGSDGSAIPLIKKMGHHLVPIVPALVQLQGKQPFFKALAGIRTECELHLFVDNRETISERGELQLTEFGISGIPVFQISRYATKALQKKQAVSVLLDFMPDVSADVLEKILKKRFLQYAHGKSAGESMIGLLNKKLSGVLLKEAGISLQKPAADISEAEQKRLCSVIKGLHVDIIGSKSYEQAQVCAGGVATEELENQTLMSKYISGIYFAGEVIDIDGTCGGYNLQWAWSSGYVAGQAAAERALARKDMPK